MLDLNIILSRLKLQDPGFVDVLAKTYAKLKFKKLKVV